ncbi:MAG: hypothetical protein II356_03705 [Clostridia bacterium]|nr:hypothetical protein [Clostridia bacterium]
MKKTASKILSFLMVLTVLSSAFCFNLSALDVVLKPSDSVVIIPPKDPPSGKVVTITYECCENCSYKKTFTYTEGKEIKAEVRGGCLDGKNAFVCWVDEKGNRYYGGDTLPFESVTLKAEKIPLLLSGDEVLSFSNSDEYYHTEEFDGYYMNEADYKAMQRNITRVFGFGTFPTTGLLVALSTYKNWEWVGSCYGMSSLAFLQHYGVIDVLEPEKGVDSLSDFTNSADVASKINYYQWSAAGSFLCENFALKKGTQLYSRQIEKLYETVSEGNVVLFTFYSGDIFVSSGHTVLLVGAYTEDDGTRVLISYDPNNPEDYQSGKFEQRFYIDPECTYIKKVYNAEQWAYLYVNAFNWTDDYRHFEPFNMDCKGSVSQWYSHFAKQLVKNAGLFLESLLKK